MAKPKQKTKQAARPLDAIVADTFALSLTYLHKQIELITQGKAEETEHDPASRVAYLAKQISQVAAEKRKTETAAKKQLEKLSRSVVVAWLRQLEPDERRSIAREINAMESEGSILS